MPTGTVKKRCLSRVGATRRAPIRRGQLQHRARGLTLAVAFAAVLCKPASADDCTEYRVLLDEMSAALGSDAFLELGRKAIAVRQVVLETRALWPGAVRALEASVASIAAWQVLLDDITALEGLSERRRLLLLRRGLEAQHAAMLAEDEVFYAGHCVAPPEGR